MHAALMMPCGHSQRRQYVGVDEAIACNGTGSHLAGYKTLQRLTCYTGPRVNRRRQSHNTELDNDYTGLTASGQFSLNSDGFAHAGGSHRPEKMPQQALNQQRHSGMHQGCAAISEIPTGQRIGFLPGGTRMNAVHEILQFWPTRSLRLHGGKLGGKAEHHIGSTPVVADIMPRRT